MANSTPEFHREHHRLVANVLRRLDSASLQQAECFFGGGTHLAMKLGEYRESRDIDFLCSSRPGFRLLREQVTEQSLGRIMIAPLPLAREVRADRDGIRTFIEVDGVRIKFEILLEGRIDLAGHQDSALGVPALDWPHAIAEKLLANADRGLDRSSLSRDLVDLAFAVTHLERSAFDEGMRLAETVYGTAVRRLLGQSLDQFREDRAHANSCVTSLGITDRNRLRKGLRTLTSLAK